jgi:hypothetical protein
MFELISLINKANKAPSWYSCDFSSWRLVVVFLQKYCFLASIRRIFHNFFLFLLNNNSLEMSVRIFLIIIAY